MIPESFERNAYRLTSAVEQLSMPQIVEKQRTFEAPCSARRASRSNVMPMEEWMPSDVVKLFAGPTWIPGEEMPPTLSLRIQFQPDPVTSAAGGVKMTPLRVMVVGLLRKNTESMKGLGPGAECEPSLSKMRASKPA